MPQKIKMWKLFESRPAMKAPGTDKRADDPIRQANLRIYKSSTWQRLRRMQLAQCPLCVVCGDPGAHIDHIQPLRAGGAAYDPRNLQTLCAPCHSRKTRQEAVEAAERGGVN